MCECEYEEEDEEPTHSHTRCDRCDKQIEGHDILYIGNYIACSPECANTLPLWGR